MFSLYNPRFAAAISLPSGGTPVPADGIGQLMTGEVSRAQGTPPVAANACSGHARQVPGCVAAARVHHPDRDAAAGLLHGQRRSLSLLITTAASKPPARTSTSRCAATLTSLPFSS